MEIGIYTFGELTSDAVTPEERLADLVEEAVLADELGLDVFAVGEHHRPDFTVSAPSVVLGAIASRTERIRLSSAVSVLSSDDPVRVFQQFATLDLLSHGRAEIMAGRGSFIESFPLFGHDLDDYDELFAEKLDLLMRIRGSERVTWSGRHRAPIHDLAVYPRPVQDPLPVWVAVGGSPQSAVRAGAMGLPLALAIIGGMPERFAPVAELHRRAARESGHGSPPPMSINSHGLIADTAEEAADVAFPAYAAMMDRIGRERGWPPMGRAEFDATRTLRGANFIGSPQDVIDKILFQHEIFGHDRFLMQMSVGTLPHAAIMRSIELLATEVAPAVRRELESKAPERLGAM
jgi:probable LLM family oxidoreductase